MFSPKYQLRITKKCFPNEKFICLGTQLILIINVLKDFLPQHMWYGADIEAEGKKASQVKMNSSQINLIGTDLDFIQYCEGIDQFIWGDFLCIDNNFSSQNIEEVKLITEDEEFRPIACNGILAEIRTFDTSYFEIYSESKKIIDMLSNEFILSELACKD